MVTSDCYNCHIGLVDNQQTIRAIHNNVIAINALFINGAFIEGHNIPSGICAFTMRRNSFEYSIGVICRIAINRFQLAVIGLVAAVGLEGYILVQFENNYIRRFIRTDRKALASTVLQGISLRCRRRFSDFSTEGLSGNRMTGHFLIVPLINHSVAQVAARAPASGEFNRLIRHCKEAVFIDYNSSCGPAAEDITVQSRCSPNLDGVSIRFHGSLGSLRCARGGGPGIAVGHLMGVALIVQGNDVASNANGQGIFRRCGNPCVAGDILFVLLHRNLLFEGLSVVDHRIFQILARILFLVPHRIAQVRPLCPDRVQVCAGFGNKDGISSNVVCIATRGSGPAGEGVAGGGGEADGCYRFYGRTFVGSETSSDNALVATMVGQGRSGRCLGVVGGEGHIAGHLNGLTGLIDLAVLAVCFVLPVEEPQIAVDGTQDRGIAAALVDVAVNILRILLNIGNLKGIHRSGEVGNQGYISIELGIRVEQRLCIVAVYGEPGAGLFAIIVLSDLLHQRLIAGGILQRGAVGNAQRFRRAVDVDCQINGSTDLGGLPLGIKGDVLGGHGLAVEHESIAFTGLVIIPAVKHVSLRHIGRTFRRIAHTVKRLLILQRLGLLFVAFVDEDDVVAVTGVVELGVVVAFPNAAGPLSKLKAGDGVLVFL